MSKKRKALLLVVVTCIPLLLAGSLFAILYPTGINMIFGTHFSHSLKTDINAAREALRLAELPPSAADLHREDWTNFFSGAVYLKFSAPIEEIEAFLSESDGLAGVKPSLLAGDDLIYSYFEGLPWFNPSASMSYVYEVDAEDGFGNVIYDRENNAIYIMYTW